MSEIQDNCPSKRAEVDDSVMSCLITLTGGSMEMERRKRRNWMLVMMLVIAVTFSNVCPIIAAELPDQMALEKLRKSDKSLR